ncbi:uncharacterized protein LOC121413021 [Lytechinus variegatus]|uniref:uncharacterized protein LOC121413021 n=1 Tax=Lytechinus variegatus TaxID=7654 RepID=UPI001BB161FC|nr:uncharacterized protein LOC121413021 [Lytechinus variegatus]
MAANVNDDVVPDSVLSRMSRTLREVETLILNDERVLAKVKLDAVKVNLERVAAGLAVEMHGYLKECVNKLLDICQREEGDEHDVDDDHEASSNGSMASRIISEIHSEVGSKYYTMMYQVQFW